MAPMIPKILEDICEMYYLSPKGKLKCINKGIVTIATEYSKLLFACLFSRIFSYPIMISPEMLKRPG